MKFIFVLSILLVVVLAACGGEDNTEPPAELVNFKATAIFSLLWSSSTGSGDRQQYLFIEPLIFDDSIVTADRDGTITIISSSDGSVIDELDIGATLSAGIGGNSESWLISTRNGEVISIDANTRKLAWRTRVPSEVLSKPLIHDDAVIVRTVDGQVVSLDLDSGKINWSYRQTIPALTLRGSGQPVLTSERLYVGLENGRVIALSPENGEVIWDVALSVPEGRSEIQRLVDIDGRSELFGNILYSAGFQGRIAAVNVANGQFVWARAFSSFTGVTLQGKIIYSSDDRSHIWALDRYNGATLWKQDKLQARNITRPVSFGDYLVFGDYAGYLHVLSRFDGRFVARTQVGDPDVENTGSSEDNGILVAPVVKGDQILVTTRDGMLYAYTLKQL